MATVQVKIAGNDLTGSVIFSTAKFMSAVNGVAGEANLRVRDLTSSLSITPGATLELLVDGDPVWTGWCMQVKRVYVFPSIDVAAFGPARFFDIIGADINLLLTKRVVANYGAGTEENIYAPLYAAHTADTTVITEFFANWLDLSGDSIDTSTDVHNVGDINEDQQARPWEGSDTWAQAMQSISALPAAIFYIRPNRNFAYVDTDTPDAPFGLSDQPNGSTFKGYREVGVLLDGTNLANDILAWGAGYGSNTPIFTRAQDSTSQADHGLWQLGSTTFGVYKQDTIDRIADSLLNGSPDHHRGQKDDRHAVTLVTYENGLLPAQKVNFESNAFGFSEVLPIRKMEVTFEVPDKPRYALTLSQEIDAPWSFFDPYRLNFPGWPGQKPFTWVPPNIVVPRCSNCGITDFGFPRAASGDWGTSDSSLVWEQFDGDTPGSSSGLSYDVVNGVGIITATDVGIEFGSIDLHLPLTEYVITCTIAYTSGASGAGGFICMDSPSADSTHFLKLSFWHNQIQLGDGSNVSSNLPFTFDGTPVNVKIEFNASETKVKVWYFNVPEPSSWMLTESASDRTGLDYAVGYEADGAQANGATWEVSRLQVSDLSGAVINRCSQFVFDNFERTVASGWDTSTDGHTWTENLLTGSSWSVNGHQGIEHLNAGTSNEMRALTNDGGGWTSPAWTMNVDWTPTFGSGGAHTIIDIVNHSDSRITGIDLDIAGSHFAGSAGGSPSVSFTYVTGTLYHIVWEMVSWVGDAQHWRAKIYADGDPDPGWLLDYTNASRTTQDATNYLIIYSLNQSSGTAYEAKFNQIDFDYAGKPCYIDCSGSSGTTVFDDFVGRTLSGSWGHPSSNPVNDWFDNGSATIGVSGGFGFADLTNSTFMDEIYQDLGNPNLDWSGEFTVSIDFVHDGLDVESFVEYFLAIIDNDTSETSNAFVYISNETGDQSTVSTAVGQTGGPPLDSAFANITTNPGAGVVTHLKWHFQPGSGVSEIKYWADPDPEPAYMASCSTAGTTTNHNKRLRVDSDSSFSVHVDFTNLTFSGDCGPVPPVPEGPLIGEWRENGVRIDSTHYQLSRAIAPGTAIVWQDGFILVAGTEFTEDDAAGIIVLITGVADTVTITVNYQATGMPT